VTIGGEDLVLPFPWEPADRNRIVRFFRQLWPDGVYEDANTAYAGRFSDALLFAPPSAEFFAYASLEAWAAWEADGATAANQDTMVHVLGSPSGITLVVDRAHGPFEGIWEELSKAIVRNRFIPDCKDRSVA